VTEILTESFCERCGTRYTFESAAPRRSRLGRVRTLGKGMKNFVLSDDASFSEAMAVARSEEELAAVNHQLDAFHQTFNFCLTCRQYTCGDCWNTGDGRCLTCAPIPGMEEPASVLADAPVFLPDTAEAALADGNGAAPGEVWPDADLSTARLSRALGLDEAEAAAFAEAELDDEAFDADGLAVPGAAAVAWAAGDVVAETETERAAGDAVEFEAVEFEAVEFEAVEAAAYAEVEAEPADAVEAEPADAIDAEAADVLMVDAEPMVVAEALEPDGVDIGTAAVAAAIGAEAVERADTGDDAPQITGVAPGQSLEDAIAAYEAQLAADDRTDAPLAWDETPELVAETPVPAEVADTPLPAEVAETATAPEPVLDADVALPGAAPAIEPEPAVDPEVVLAAAATLEVEPEATPEPAIAAMAHEPLEDGIDPLRAALAAAALAGEPEVSDGRQSDSASPVTAPEPAAPTVDAPSAAEPRDDVVPQPTWPAAATPAADIPAPRVPEPAQPAPPAPASPWLTVAPDETGEAPQWPIAPAWPSAQRREMPSTLAGRPLLPQADPSGLWAASAREVLSGASPAPQPQVATPVPTAQPCVNCGLSLSATARFCRRCGTRQG
jgi:hypothetical protein